jgi:hypothetical protein
MAGRRLYLFGVFGFALSFLAVQPALTTYAVSGSSQFATWSCTGSPCPWGSSLGNDAIVWPASASPVNVRHGYTVSAGVYLPAANANGMTVSLQSGSATAYAGTPSGGSHRVLGRHHAGEIPWWSVVSQLAKS